ncbi:MAG: hypothetical protein KDB84_04135 [Flavobacteriales bacterium]|nr:hypothetical protein [Flavobacteriales bacterium]
MVTEPVDVSRRVEEVFNKGKQAHFAWLRHILTMASGLVAIIVALRAGGAHTGLQHICFVLSVALLAAGILFGAVALYAEVALYQALGRGMAREMQRRLSGAEPSPDVAVAISGGFRVAALCCYVSLALGLVALVIYAAVQG